MIKLNWKAISNECARPSSSGLLRAVIGAGAENLICESSIDDLDRSFFRICNKVSFKKRRAIIKSGRIRPPPFLPKQLWNKSYTITKVVGTLHYFVFILFPFKFLILSVVNCFDFKVNFYLTLFLIFIKVYISFKYLFSFLNL